MSEAETIERPLVSVIMPFLRAVDTIERAIDSVLAQSMPRFELVAVADGSTDGSIAIVEGYAARDPRVRLLKYEKNGGPGFARNRAIEAARGEWIAVLDADDWYAPRRLELLVDAAAEAPIVVDNLMGREPYDGSQTGVLFEIMPKSLRVEDIVQHDVPGSTYNFGYLKPVVRRAFIEQHGLRYDESLRTGEDLMFLLGCCIRGGPIKTVSDALYHYNLQISLKKKQISMTTHSLPLDREMASTLNALLVDHNDALDASARHAIEARAGQLMNGADVSTFRYLLRRRDLAGALKLFGASSKVRSYAFDKARRSVLKRD
jgi:succinoglycan biosynthesis protein ExoO